MPGKVLVVDDHAAMRQMLATVLAGQYELAAASSGDEALAVADAFGPDIVLLDIMMSGLDGHETCRRLKRATSLAGVPQVIMISAHSSREEQVRAFEAGADDYLVKPVDQYELRSRVALHLRLRHALADVADLKGAIESHVADFKQIADRRSQEIIATQDITVFTLARVAESRDETTGKHLVRMRSYAHLLAEHLARNGPYREQIDHEFLNHLYRSSPLHDIGKVGIRDSILLKPGLLTHAEFETIKTHTVIGANLLDDAVYHSHSGGFLAMAAVIARFHHERFDGTGYPAGLSGQAIPLPARIVAVADVFDALTSNRPYKPAYGPDTAREIIEEGSGKAFDPVVVDAFRSCYDDVLEVMNANSDEFSLVVGAMSFREHEPAATFQGPASMFV
ncbi:MAG: response regulator [Thermoguttaceae bacterium]